MIVRAAIASLALLTAPSLFAADIGRLELPDFRHLQSKATESVDISIGPMMLWLATHLAPERDENGTEIRNMLKGIEAVHVRSYQFDEDGAYSKDDIESVRRQLRDEQWQPLAEIHSKRNDENVDIFIAIENDKPAGFAILASEAREFTIVNIVGTIDPQHIGQLQRNLDLPGGSRRVSTIND